MKRSFMETHYPIRVLRGDTLLGTLKIDDYDQPWLLCFFTPAPAFSEVRDLFEAALYTKVSEASEASRAARKEARKHIDALNLRLVAVNGESSMFILHIDGERASFRYADFVPYRGIDRYGWKISEDLLPGPSQQRLPGTLDRWFVNVRTDTTCLVYETGETRRDHPVGLIAIYEHEAAPRLVLNPQRFQCAATDETVKWYDAFARGTILRVEAFADEQLIFALLDLPHHRFSWLDDVDVSAQEVWDMGKYLQVVEERPDGRYEYLQCFSFDALAWFSLDRIDDFAEIRRASA